MNMNRAFVERYWGGKIDVLGGNPVPVPFFQHKLHLDWTGPPGWGAGHQPPEKVEALFPALACSFLFAANSRPALDLLTLEYEGSTLVRNVGMLLPCKAVSYAKTELSTLPLRKLQKSNAESLFSHSSVSFFPSASISVCPSFWVYLLYSSTYTSILLSISDVGLSFPPFIVNAVFANRHV
jgi:hypothetical protein